MGGSQQVLNYEIGSIVEIYSSKEEKWISGTIAQIDEKDSCCVMYGKNVSWVSKASKKMRLSQIQSKESIQSNNSDNTNDSNTNKDDTNAPPTIERKLTRKPTIPAPLPPAQYAQPNKIDRSDEPPCNIL